MTVGKQVAWIADDFGLSTGVNEAILHAHHRGVLTGASLMMGQPGTADAVERALSEPRLEVGWHLHLCDSVPLTMPEWPWGSSPVRAGFALASTAGTRRRVRREIEAQWAAFQKTGLRCRFINTHHHLHLHPWVAGVLGEIAVPRENAWFRGGAFRLFGVSTSPAALVTRCVGPLLSGKLPSPGGLPVPVPTTVWGLDRVHRMQAAEVAATVAALPDGLHEFMFHPRSLREDADLEALVALAGIFGNSGTPTPP